MTAKLLWEVYSRGELADIGVTDLPETEGRVWIEFCPECGSGILDGEHIAIYPCSQRATGGDTGQGTE